MLSLFFLTIVNLKVGYVQIVLDVAALGDLRERVLNRSGNNAAIRVSLRSACDCERLARAGLIAVKLQTTTTSRKQ